MKRTLAVVAVAVVMAGCESPTQTLTRRPYAPTDRSMFTPAVYPEAPAMVPASGAERSEAAVVTMLNDYLAAEYPNNTQARAQVVALFNDLTARQKIPSPTLRAAFATMKGLRNCIDNKNGGLSDAELVSAARALKLDTSRRGS